MRNLSSSGWFEKPWTFLTGAADVSGLPPPALPEIAFAGRSNAGKSSLLNALVGQHGLARASKAPGRTQQINFFEARGVPFRLVDLPGYGYARAPKSVVSLWESLVGAYLAGRGSLVRVYLLADCRVGLKPVDRAVMELLDRAAVAYEVVLTKTDKLHPAEAVAAATAAAAVLAAHPAAFPRVLVTSSATGAGIADLRTAIETALGNGPPGA